MPDLTEAEAVAYVKELRDLEAAGERTTLVLGPYTAFIMIASLQLAARHHSMTAGQRDTLAAFTGQAMTLFTGTPGEALLRGEAAP
jgi:hypothetical protein